MAERKSNTTPGTPRLHGEQKSTGTGTPPRSALAEALQRTPIRRDSFDRPNGFPAFDSTPRRFSTGAHGIPMPAPQVFAAQLASEQRAQLDGAGCDGDIGNGNGGGGGNGGNRNRGGITAREA
ncbi:hypothetical protein KC315_g19110, partial [Hortaea werneckii]